MQKEKLPSRAGISLKWGKCSRRQQSLLRAMLPQMHQPDNPKQMLHLWLGNCSSNILKILTPFIYLTCRKIHIWRQSKGGKRLEIYSQNWDFSKESDREQTINVSLFANTELCTLPRGEWGIASVFTKYHLQLCVHNITSVSQCWLFYEYKALICATSLTGDRLFQKYFPFSSD